MNLLIKDNFFSNPDVLRRFALDCDYIDSEKVKVDVGWRGYRTDEFENIGNKHLITASEKVKQAVCEYYNLEGYSISSHFHISHKGTKKTLPDFENKKYHFDQCDYAGVVYLKPSPPRNTGTSLLNGANTADSGDGGTAGKAIDRSTNVSVGGIINSNTVKGIF